VAMHRPYEPGCVRGCVSTRPMGTTSSWLVCGERGDGLAILDDGGCSRRVGCVNEQIACRWAEPKRRHVEEMRSVWTIFAHSGST